VGGPHYLVFPLAGLVLKAVKLGGENAWVKESQQVNVEEFNNILS
jgi:hypothetical protein